MNKKLYTNYLDEKRKRVKQSSVMARWIRLYQENIQIAQYCRKWSLKSVAIYGMDTVGQLLYSDLRSNNIDIVYTIDRDANSKYSEVPIYTLESDIEVDLIILTVLVNNEEIIKRLKKNYRVKTIEEIIDELAEGVKY